MYCSLCPKYFLGSVGLLLLVVLVTFFTDLSTFFFLNIVFPTVVFTKSQVKINLLLTLHLCIQ